jgi:hypothetical protein
MLSRSIGSAIFICRSFCLSSGIIMNLFIVVDGMFEPLIIASEIPVVFSTSNSYTISPFFSHNTSISLMRSIFSFESGARASRSMAIAFLPRLSASIAVTPLPTKGSRTISPFLE